MSDDMRNMRGYIKDRIEERFFAEIEKGLWIKIDADIYKRIDDKIYDEVFNIISEVSICRRKGLLICLKNLIEEPR